MNPLNSSLEEILERLYVGQVERGETAAPTAPDWPADALREAVAAGLLDAGDGGTVRLTDRGRDAGRDVVRRHRLAECLLRDVLEMRGEDINPDACQIEHIIHHGLDEKICVLLGHPTVCPHGHPIPPGVCCTRARQDEVREVKPLCDGRMEGEGTVAYLSSRDNREIQKLMAMGVLPGTHIRLLRRFPSYVFQVGYSQFTVDRELAEKIVVHWQT